MSPNVNIALLIERAAERWRDEGAEEALEELRDAPIAPEDRTFWLWQLAELDTARWQARLEAFGLKIDRQGPLKITASPEGRTISNWSSFHYCWFEECLNMFLLCEFARRELLRAFAEAEEDPHEAALCAYHRAFTEFPVRLTGAGMETAPLEQQRFMATISLAGYAHQKIRLYPRLRRALSAYDDQPGRKKLEELPASVCMAWDQCGREEDLNDFVNSVSRLLGELSHDVEGTVDSDFSDIEDYQFVQKFAEREQARAEIDELRERAGLSPREAEVLDLQLDDYSVKDTAKELGISTTTVETYRQRMRDKLRAAAS